MNSHSQTIEELQQQLKTTPEGLSSAEAQNRLKEYGENRLKEAKKQSLLIKFLEQFRDVSTRASCFSSKRSFAA